MYIIPDGMSENTSEYVKIMRRGGIPARVILINWPCKWYVISKVFFSHVFFVHPIWHTCRRPDWHSMWKNPTKGPLFFVETGRKQRPRNPQPSVSTIPWWMPKYTKHPCVALFTIEILMSNHIEDVLQHEHQRVSNAEFFRPTFL